MSSRIRELPGRASSRERHDYAACDEKKMTRNRLVVVAGGPGAGKTTLMEHLAGGAVTMHGAPDNPQPLRCPCARIP